MTVETSSGRGLSPVGALAVVGGLLAITAWSGRRFAPSPSHPEIKVWYRELDKPGFTPPDAVFGGTWAVIQLVLSYGGYRLLRRPSAPDRDLAVGMWGLNNLLIAGWNALFFGKRDLKLSAVTAAGMVVAAGSYATVAARTDRTAAATALPLTGWLGFATLLATVVWRRNR